MHFSEIMPKLKYLFSVARHSLRINVILFQLGIFIAAFYASNETIEKTQYTCSTNYVVY